MLPEESSYELAFAETLVVRLFGVLESIVLFQCIALQGLMLTGRLVALALDGFSSWRGRPLADAIRSLGISVHGRLCLL